MGEGAFTEERLEEMRAAAERVRAAVAALNAALRAARATGLRAEVVEDDGVYVGPLWRDYRARVWREL